MRLFILMGSRYTCPTTLLPRPWLLILTGAFLMVSRKKALMQMLGLLVLENGIFLAALTTTFGMPLVIEIGIFFDVLDWAASDGNLYLPHPRHV